MDNQSIINKAIAKIESTPGYSYSREKVIATVEAGLQDGDNIYLGQNAGKAAHCKVVGDTAQMILGDKIMAEIKLANLSADQIASILASKAAAAAQTGHAIGSVKA